MLIETSSNSATWICSKPHSVKVKTLSALKSKRHPVRHYVWFGCPPPYSPHYARTSLWSGWWLVCFGAGRKRRMVRFLTPLAVQRPPLSSRAWALARSTRSNWRWWRTTSVDRLPPRTSSQVSVHIHAANWLINLLFQTYWDVFYSRRVNIYLVWRGFSELTLRSISENYFTLLFLKFCEEPETEMENPHIWGKYFLLPQNKSIFINLFWYLVYWGPNV